MKLKQLFLRKSQPVLGLILLIVFSGCTEKPGKQSTPVLEPKSVIEKIRLKDLNDQPIDLNQYRGKAVFINFWATWCGPCIKEMPSIEKARDILKDHDIEFFFASNEEAERIQTFSKSHDLKLNFVHVENIEELNIQALPTTFIISPSGKLAFSETGFRNWDDAGNIELLTKIINSNE